MHNALSLGLTGRHKSFNLLENNQENLMTLEQMFTECVHMEDGEQKKFRFLQPVARKKVERLAERVAAEKLRQGGYLTVTIDGLHAIWTATCTTVI